jgi:hypothetical protein
VDGQETLGVEAVRESLLRLRLRREGVQPSQGGATAHSTRPRWAFWRP